MSGTFSTIDWGGGSKFIQVELVATGGASFINMGTQQMLSVPYALNAGNGNWTKTVNDISNSNSGNVGIGTTTPAAKLDVIGNIKFTDGTQGINKVLTSDANGLASWQTPAGGNSATTLLVNTNVAVNANSTPTTMFSFTIPANRLTENRKLKLRCTIDGNNSGGTVNATITLKFNGTSMCALGTIINGAKLGPNSPLWGYFDFEVYGITSGSQTTDGRLSSNQQNNAGNVMWAEINTCGGQQSIDCTSPVAVSIVISGSISGGATLSILRCKAYLE